MVGQPHMHRIGIRRRMHSHRFDAHFTRCAMNASAISPRLAIRMRLMAINLSADHNQRLVKFDRLPVFDVDRLHGARDGAVMGFITFMASTISSVSPALTALPTVMKSAAPGSGAR
jgi:hypothetical protein